MPCLQAIRKKGFRCLDSVGCVGGNGAGTEFCFYLLHRDGMGGLTMTHRQYRMIAVARLRYGKIKPCDKAKYWCRSFTVGNGKILFWFNDCTDSTHIIHVERKNHDTSIAN